MIRGLDRYLTGNYGEDQFRKEPPMPIDPNGANDVGDDDDFSHIGPRVWPVSTEDFEEDHAGICLDCGEIASGCEPDARNYLCESCNTHQVFGMEEALLMGRITLPDKDDN